MRRRPDTLVPLAASILATAIDLATPGVPHFHGFLIARELRAGEGARLLTAQGTRYRALDQLRRAGLLDSEWEALALAEGACRPRRRLYRVTTAEQAARAKQAAEQRPPTGRLNPRMAAP